MTGPGQPGLKPIKPVRTLAKGRVKIMWTILDNYGYTVDMVDTEEEAHAICKYERSASGEIWDYRKSNIED